MAHVKAGGTTKGNRDAISKRLGIKVYGKGKVINGNIIVRQRGTKFHSGTGTKLAHDYSIYAIQNGIVEFKRRRGDTIVEVK